MLWYRAVEGAYDAYTAWLNAGAVPFSRAVWTLRSTQRNARILRRIYSARAGMGASFARRPLISEFGVITGYEETLLIVRFKIRRTDEREVLEVSVSRRTARVGLQERRIPSPNVFDQADRRNLWLARTIQPAIQGFIETAVLHRPDFEQRRNLFQGQLRQMKLFGAAFRERIDRLDDWQDALRLVQEPWQLALVVEAYCGEAFCAHAGIMDPEPQRVSRMLHQFTCGPRQREDLLTMAQVYGLI